MAHLHYRISRLSPPHYPILSHSALHRHNIGMATQALPVHLVSHNSRTPLYASSGGCCESHNLAMPVAFCWLHKYYRRGYRGRSFRNPTPTASGPKLPSLFQADFVCHRFAPGQRTHGSPQNYDDTADNAHHDSVRMAVLATLPQFGGHRHTSLASPPAHL